MKLFYKGSLYEENYHNGPTAIFNLDFINDLHNVAETIGNSIFQIVKKGDVELNKEIFVTNLGNIQIFVKFGSINASMQVTNYSDKSILEINSDMVEHFKFDRMFFITLLHEVIHIYQEQNGLKPDISDNWDGKRLENYLNDPFELNAYLTSIISYITYYPKKIEEFKNLSFNDFVKECLALINASEEGFFDELHFSTKNKILEVFRLFQAKLKQGFFDRFNRSIS